jgi:hypothetical protein
MLSRLFERPPLLAAVRHSGERWRGNVQSAEGVGALERAAQLRAGGVMPSEKLSLAIYTLATGDAFAVMNCAGNSGRSVSLR